MLVNVKLMHVLFASLLLNIVTDIKETATAVNHTLMKLVSLQVEDEGKAPALRNVSGK